MAARLIAASRNSLALRVSLAGARFEIFCGTERTAKDLEKFGTFAFFSLFNCFQGQLGEDCYVTLLPAKHLTRCSDPEQDPEQPREGGNEANFGHLYGAQIDAKAR